MRQHNRGNILTLCVIISIIDILERERERERKREREIRKRYLSLFKVTILLE